MHTHRVAIVGTVGVPANYGGFETLTENLLRVHAERVAQSAEVPALSFVVYCSSRAYDVRRDHYLGAELRYVPIGANGLQSMLYDAVSLFSAAWRGADAVLLLGVSGGLALPLIRIFTRVRIVTNIDGLEWRRGKWNPLAKRLLRLLEWLAVRSSHMLVADNTAIADYVKTTHRVNSRVIAYGGDHAVAPQAASIDELGLPERYALSIGRVEPENNPAMIAEAFAEDVDCTLVAVGNWERSEFGRQLRQRYSAHRNIVFLDPIYDLAKLKTLRSNALFYVHGHSAGGTNPSLVEAMHFGIPVMAYDCVFNRGSTEDSALYFDTAQQLRELIREAKPDVLAEVGMAMKSIAERRYTWDVVASQYFSLLESMPAVVDGAESPKPLP